MAGFVRLGSLVGYSRRRSIPVRIGRFRRLQVAGRLTARRVCAADRTRGFLCTDGAGLEPRSDQPQSLGSGLYTRLARAVRLQHRAGRTASPPLPTRFAALKKRSGRRSALTQISLIATPAFAVNH